MSGEIIQFIVIITIFGLLNVLGAKGKKKKKPKPNIFDELNKQLKELEKSFEVPTQEPTTPTIKKVKKKEHLMSNVESLEITEAPYSNLEKGIIDSVHRSKFEHHDTEIEEIDEVLEEEVDYFEDFDARKAFVHSLIFERKYFKV